MGQNAIFFIKIILESILMYFWTRNSNSQIFLKSDINWLSYGHFSDFRDFASLFWTIRPITFFKLRFSSKSFQFIIAET